MNLLRILGCKLGLWRLAVLQDFDEELNLRIVRKPWHPKYAGLAYRMSTCKALLNHDGTVAYPSFVTSWHPYPYRDQLAEEIGDLEKMYHGGGKP